MPPKPPKPTKTFQHTAARRRLVIPAHLRDFEGEFQHTAARRRLAGAMRFHAPTIPFQHTAARRRLATTAKIDDLDRQFQHTAARRRLDVREVLLRDFDLVSTHSRPKAAGIDGPVVDIVRRVSTHSRPKAAGHRRRHRSCFLVVSTHSRPKAAGQTLSCFRPVFCCFNTQPPEGGWSPSSANTNSPLVFQHTAARRRLAPPPPPLMAFCSCFNTQPPEGGWPMCNVLGGGGSKVSTHSRPKAAGPMP